MTFTFNEQEKEKITQHFGGSFLTHVEDQIEPLSQKWSLSQLKLIPSYSANLVVEGQSETHGQVVLKFARNEQSLKSEVEALASLQCQAICRVLDVDEDKRVFLINGISPGTTLRSEEDITLRLEAFCELFGELHAKTLQKETGLPSKTDEDIRDSYQNWITRANAFVSKQADWKEVADHMNRAAQLFHELSVTYNRQTLLHGDFHYYNILKSEDGYTIIDPKGVVGDPVFDLPRYMLNEYWDQKDKNKVDETVDIVIDHFSTCFNLSQDTLAKLLYIEGVLSKTWSVQDGMGLEEKEETVVSLDQLYGYIPQ